MFKSLIPICLVIVVTGAAVCTIGSIVTITGLQNMEVDT